MKWGVWQNFTRALESLKIGTLLVSFSPILKIYWLKIYRGVMCHNKKEWCKIWRGIDLAVQNWYEEFDEFWLEHLKISEICTLMGCFWQKHKMFELKKYTGICLMALNINAKFVGKLTCVFKNDMRNLANIHQSMFEKMRPWWNPFIQSRKCKTLKFTG